MMHISSSTFAFRLTSLLLWASVLAWLSLAPLDAAPAGAFAWDKLNHYGAYAVLAFLLVRLLNAWQALSPRLLLTAWLLAVAYGLLIEILQGVMAAGREMDAGDFVANALGALTACVIFRHVRARSLLS